MPLAALRRHPVFAVGIGLLLSAPALFTGWVHDDYSLLSVWRGAVPAMSSDWSELFAFFSTERIAPLRDQGVLPWWTDDSLSIRFFRPLGSAAVALDLAVLGPTLGHLHGLIWFAVLLVAALRLYRMLLPERAARWAGLLFATAGCHTLASTWIAAQPALMAATFGAWALWAHLRARRDAWRPGSWLGPLLTALAVLSAEAGLGVFALVGAYEVFGRSDSRSRRALALAPYSLIFAVYVAHYAAAGYGAQGSALYVSPLAEPARFAMRIGLLLPVFAGDVLLGVPAMAHTANEPSLPLFIALGVGACVTLASVLRGLWPKLGAMRQTVPWLLAAATLAAVPAAGGVPGGRALLLTALCCAPVVGTCVGAVEQNDVRKALRWCTYALAASAIVVGCGTRVSLGMLGIVTSRAEARVGRTLLDRCPGGSPAVLVASSDPSVAMYGTPAAATFAPRDYPRVYVWSMAPDDHELRRLDEHTFELEVLPKGPSRRALPFERLFRSVGAPLRAGHKVRTAAFEVEVVDAEPSGFRAARFRLAQGTSAASVCWLQWRDDALHPLTLPATGQGITLKHHPGPMGL